MPSQPAQGAPSAVCCLATARHTIPGARSSAAQSPVTFALSERVSAWAGAVGSPRSHGLGTQHWWLQCRERLKLQSTAHVTQAQNRTRAAPGPRGADGVTKRKQQEHSWESCDALAANWTMTRQRGLHQWGLGTCQLGSEGPRWWHRGYASTWLHEVTMIMATTQKIKQEHTHRPGELNANISLQVWKRLLLQLETGWGSYGAEGGKDESWSFSCWRWYVCSVWCPSQRTLNECASNHVHKKEPWVMEIHSYHSYSSVMNVCNQYSKTASS